MTSYHIAKSGKVAVCKAQSEASCPLQSKHFDSKDRAEFYAELPQETQLLRYFLDEPFASRRSRLDALSDREIARRLMLGTALNVASDYRGFEEQAEALTALREGGYVQGDVTWNHDVLDGEWKTRRIASHISPPGFSHRAEQLNSPKPRRSAPAADPQFAAVFQGDFPGRLDAAATKLSQMAQTSSMRGVVEERRLYNKAAAVRQVREEWGPRFAQVQSREELQQVLHELKAARNQVPEGWQNAGWDEGIDLVESYANEYLRSDIDLVA